MKVALNKIRLDPNNPRKIILEQSIKNLAKSMETEGLIHQIEISKDYMVIVGEMRYRAAKLLGWSEIDANVYQGELTPYERLRRQMAENLQQSGAQGGGQPMNAIDTAKAWVRLYELKTNKTYSPGEQMLWDEKSGHMKGAFSTIAEEIGVGQTSVWEYLKLLEQPAYVVESMIRKISPIPRTFFREAERVPTTYREKVKRAIVEGKIKNRNDIVRFNILARTKPTKAAIEFLRLTDQQNVYANRILNRSVELGLALSRCKPDKFLSKDKIMITGELTSIIRSIKIFLTKMNRPN